MGITFEKVMGWGVRQMTNDQIDDSIVPEVFNRWASYTKGTASHDDWKSHIRPLAGTSNTSGYDLCGTVGERYRSPDVVGDHPVANNVTITNYSLEQCVGTKPFNGASNATHVDDLDSVVEFLGANTGGSHNDKLYEISDAEIENWSVGNSSLISVSDDGVVTGLAHGVTTISASFGSISSDSIKIYVWAESFREDFSSVDTTTIDDGYFKGNNGIIWQMNHSLETDTSSAGPHTGKPAIVEDNGNPVLQLTEPSTAYFTNRQLLIMTYGSTTYDDFYMWPEGDDMLTLPNFRVQMRVKGIDDPVAGTSAESIVNFTQYFGGAASPYYLVYAPGRNRVSAWFGASLAPGASIPEWGSIPEITYDQWFSFVLEVFDGTMRTEIFSGVEPTGEWDYSYTIPDWTGDEENIPGLWFGAFLMDEYYADDIIYCTP